MITTKHYFYFCFYISTPNHTSGTNLNVLATAAVGVNTLFVISITYLL